MARNTVFAADEFYHLYNRGTEKRKIFTSDPDYERFLALLYMSNGTSPVHLQHQGRTLIELKEVDRGDCLVDIGAYCLMPNHFHLLVRQKVERGISTFMQKLITAYSMYFNKRYERTGGLFQGKYKVSHISEDTYLKYLLSYIHLNPVKLIDPKWKEEGIANRVKAQKYLETYKYSSYPDYQGVTRIENMLLTKNVVPDYFPNTKNFNEEVKYWLDFRAHELQGPTSTQ